MLRILIAIAWIAVTVYAIADWFRTPEEELWARMPKAMWLVLILITIPSFSLGSIAWIVLRAVSRVEAGQSPLPPLPMQRPAQARPEKPRPLAPDDDPEFLFRIERDIQREKRRSAEAGGGDGADESPAAQPETRDEGEGEGAEGGPRE